METACLSWQVIFFTIILLLQKAEEMFPLHQWQWKPWADESSFSYHAACFFLPAAGKAAKNKSAHK